MRIAFPSREFDDATAAVCHDVASDEQVRALSELLRSDGAARDEYILRLELHSRLASEPDLFSLIEPDPPVVASADRTKLIQRTGTARHRRKIWTIVLSACFAVVAAGLWNLQQSQSTDRTVTTSRAVAMLNRTVNAQWNVPEEAPRLNAPLEPGWLLLESGLAEVVFYSGARLIVEGPAELQLVSASHAVCHRGRIIAEVPPPARSFRIETPQGRVTHLVSSSGLNVKDRRTELHVFKGSVKLRAAATHAADHDLAEGSGAVIESSRTPRLIAADRSGFTSLFDMDAKSVAAEALRFDRWQAASERLNGDPSLVVRFDLEGTNSFYWQLRNACKRRPTTDATIVGCQWVEGRWSNKRALEFQSVNDRVRLNVPGRFNELTFTAWVRVQGLDRRLNSLFMSDGFVPGTVHWLIRRDGVLGLTVIGADPKDHQIVASPPVLTLEKFGMWLHLAVVMDGSAKRVAHYFNGEPLGENALRIEGPFHIGDADVGNWNGKGFPKEDAFMIRNFSGAMDEFCLFTRALNTTEIRTLYTEGRPDPGSLASH